MSRERRGGGFVCFVLGVIVGAIGGVLLAPKSGEETRKELKERADGLLEEGKDIYSTQKEKVIEAYEKGKQVAAEKTGELKKRIGEAREKLSETISESVETTKEKVGQAAKKIEEVKEEIEEKIEEKKGSPKAGK